MSDDSIMIMNKNGDRVWRNEEGQIHRTSGPAIECADGAREWWLNDQPHRADGPAYEKTDGTKVWFKNGQVHREDGPAIENADGSRKYWLNNEEWSEGEEACRPHETKRYEAELARAVREATLTARPVAPAPRAVFKSKRQVTP